MGIFFIEDNAFIFTKKIKKLIKKNMSDTDDSRTIQSEIFTPSSIRRKQTANTGLIGCSNQSHTAFFSY